MNKQNIATRFAPSPTGYMHIGNLRTALYAYLIARSKNGKFILRIEDTDRQRMVDGAEEIILKTMEITNLAYDEGPDVGGKNGPYIQSHRKEIYKEYVQKLIDSGAAYYCFCSKDEPDDSEVSKAEGDKDESTMSMGYNRACRDLSKEVVEKKLSEGVPYVIRQKMPLEGKTTFSDAVFGDITVDNKELQDQILMKADGYPTYNFAHVVDDYLMEVTHVVRGSEYLASSPKYVLLYDAFGWERPVYVHLPLLMGRNEDGSVSKLSKRHGAVSFQDLIIDGYLPEAIINYIALLGWCPKNSNEEIFSLDELKNVFSLDGINKSPATFDYDKLLWFNGEYIKKLTFDEFKTVSKKYFDDAISINLDMDKLMIMIQSRISKLSDIKEKVSFMNQVPDYSMELYINKKNKTDLSIAQSVLKSAVPIIESIDKWDNDTIFEELSVIADQLSIKKGAVMWILRIALTGTEVTPGGASEIMSILGKEESIYRVNQAYNRILRQR